MMNYPTWPCNYPDVIKKDNTVSKTPKKNKKIVKPIKSIDLDDNLSFDNIYKDIYSDENTKKEFITSLDEYLSKLTKKIKNQNFTLNKLAEGSYVLNIENNSFIPDYY